MQQVVCYDTSLVMACIQIITLLTLLYVGALVTMLVVTNVKPFISDISDTIDTNDTINASYSGENTTDVAELSAWHYGMVTNQIIIFILGKFQI